MATSTRWVRFAVKDAVGAQNSMSSAKQRLPRMHARNLTVAPVYYVSRPHDWGASFWDVFYGAKDPRRIRLYYQRPHPSGPPHLIFRGRKSDIQMGPILGSEGTRSGARAGWRALIFSYRVCVSLRSTRTKCPGFGGPQKRRYLTPLQQSPRRSKA